VVYLAVSKENVAKVFATFLKQSSITSCHTYHKNPKQNARYERVNRALQDEFMIKYANLLFDDINAFNKRLLKYPHWFNFKGHIIGLTIK
jgi:hypothetical protein